MPERTKGKKERKIRKQNYIMLLTMKDIYSTYETL